MRPHSGQVPLLDSTSRYVRGLGSWPAIAPATQSRSLSGIPIPPFVVSECGAFALRRVGHGVQGTAPARAFHAPTMQNCAPSVAGVPDAIEPDRSGSGATANSDSGEPSSSTDRRSDSSARPARASPGRSLADRLRARATRTRKVPSTVGSCEHHDGGPTLFNGGARALSRWGWSHRLSPTKSCRSGPRAFVRPQPDGRTAGPTLE